MILIKTEESTDQKDPQTPKLVKHQLFMTVLKQLQQSGPPEKL